MRIGPLLVQHGTKAGKHSALAALEDVGFQVSIMGGHVHKLSNFSKAGVDYTVHSITTGCLCQLQPHYMRGTKQYGWQQGLGIADVDLKMSELCPFWRNTGVSRRLRVRPPSVLLSSLERALTGAFRATTSAMQAENFRLALAYQTGEPAARHTLQFSGELGLRTRLAHSES